MRLTLTLVIIAVAAVLPRQADALPVFAHRYGLTCQACHTTVPHLNNFGMSFSRNGYRLPRAAHAAIPIAVKVNLAYSSDADSTGLPKAIVDEVEILTGGALGARANYFVEQYAVDGGRQGMTRDAWMQYNANADTHIRVGQFTLPLPVDPETQRDTQAHYLLYDQAVGTNPFTFFNARAGIDAYSANERGDALHIAAFSSGHVFGYGAKTIGQFTFYAYRYQGGFYREGAGVRETGGRFEIVAVLQHGHDAQAASSGGFAEAHYAFSPSLMAVARYDRIWDALSGAQQQTVISLVTRPARNMRFTIEDQLTGRHTLNLGWLFAY
jgi:hypothetical protein